MDRRGRCRRNCSIGYTCSRASDRSSPIAIAPISCRSTRPCWNATSRYGSASRCAAPIRGRSRWHENRRAPHLRRSRRAASAGRGGIEERGRSGRRDREFAGGEAVDAIGGGEAERRRVGRGERDDRSHRPARDPAHTRGDAPPSMRACARCAARWMAPPYDDRVARLYGRGGIVEERIAGTDFRSPSAHYA